MSSDDAYIQVQISGVWQTFCSTLNDPQYILSEFRNAKNLYPNYRIRAVDKDERLLDIMP